MKKLFFFCLTIFAIGTATAQVKVKETELPVVVQTSFHNQYPDAAGVEWTMKAGSYKVHFRSAGYTWLASYNAEGIIQSKGVEIKEVDMPSAISAAVKAGYPDRSVDEVFRMEKNGKTSYLVKLNGKPKTKIYYSTDGEVIKDKTIDH